MRILHVIDPASPGGGACTLRLLSEPLNRLRSIEHEVVVIGTRAHADLARRCGVEPIGVIVPPVRQALLARGGLRRLVEQRESSGGPYDIIHAWTLASGMLATTALPGHRRLATLSVGPLSGIGAQVVTRLLDHHDLPIVVASSAVERECRSLGIRARMLSILPPAANPQSMAGVARETLRRRWGVNDQILVVGLLSEPASWADARIAADVLARAVATGRAMRLVLHHSAARRVEAERWARALGREKMLVVDDDVAEPWRIAHGLDAAILIGGDLNSMDLTGAGSALAMLTGQGGRRLRPMPGVMPLLWAMAAGVPVIAEASDAVRDIVEDGRTALLVNQHDVNGAVDRLCRIFDDPTIAGRIGMNARALVSERFNVSAYCVRLRELYDRLVDQRAPRVVDNAREPVVERYEKGVWREYG